MKMIYLVITMQGYWGKGETLAEACEFANVPSTYVNGVVYRMPDHLMESLDHNGSGGVSAQWSSDVFKPEWLESGAPEDIQNLLDSFWECSKIVYGKMKFEKKTKKLIAEVC